MSERFKIAIAGAGPIGMTLAMGLAVDGHNVTVYEKGEQLAEESRASTFHPSILDQLDTYGVVDDMLREGLKVPDFQYRERHGGIIAKFNFEAISDVTKFPYRLQLEQSRLTRIVLNNLENYPNAKVEFNTLVEGISMGDDSVTAQLNANGSPREEMFDFVVGADGASSAVRKSLGIEFYGKTYPERYLVVSTDFEFKNVMPELSYVNYISDPEEWLLMLRTPNYWRIMFPIGENTSEDQALSSGFAQERLHGIYPLEDEFPIRHSTLYRVHQRLASTYQSGRVVLAGDAAHINNPLGGLGMNSGLFDAFELRKSFAAIAEGSDPLETLSDYGEKQRLVSLDYVGAQTDKNWAELRETDPEVKHERNLRMNETAKDPAKHRDFLLRTSMYKLETV